MSRALPKPTKILRERDVEKYLIQRVKVAGGEVRKVKWIGRNNAPDRLVMVYRKFALVELKRPHERATLGQIREHYRLQDCGLPVKVISTLQAVDDFMQRMKSE